MIFYARLIILTLTILLYGCGQKGALYLPESTIKKNNLIYSLLKDDDIQFYKNARFRK